MRLTATSPTDGPVTVVVIDEPSQARYGLPGERHGSRHPI